jgi:maltose alpha-D-glucosyltransferase/alpha-amylase
MDAGPQWRLLPRRPARLYAPTIMDPVYGYESVNVEAQSRSLSSLLSATKRLIAVRKSTLAFGRGTMTFIRPENRAVLCYVRQYQGEVILCVANLSRSAQATELDLSAFRTASRWKCSAVPASRRSANCPT